MRSISFSLTEPQFLAGTKTVTRRLGWGFLKPGDRLRAVRQAMGLAKGSHQVVLGEIEVLRVSREPLCAIGKAEVAREGFPKMTALEFITFFRTHMRCAFDQMVTRIEFRRVRP